MKISFLYERNAAYIVFDGISGAGIHISKDSKEGREIEAYLADHPEALVPEPVAPPPSPKELLRQEMVQLLAYLASTDWYTIRQSETDEEIPVAVLAERADARRRISDIREMV